MKCSFLELYNEESTDLLAVGDAADQKLKMLEDSGRVVVQACSLPGHIAAGVQMGAICCVQYMGSWRGGKLLRSCACQP